MTGRSGLSTTVMLMHAPGGQFHRIMDLHVTGAAADIA